jgi:hypothetical protein
MKNRWHNIESIVPVLLVLSHMATIGFFTTPSGVSCLIFNEHLKVVSRNLAWTISVAPCAQNYNGINGYDLMHNFAMGINHNFYLHCFTTVLVVCFSMAKI